MVTPPVERLYETFAINLGRPMKYRRIHGYAVPAVEVSVKLLQIASIGILIILPISLVLDFSKKGIFWDAGELILGLVAMNVGFLALRFIFRLLLR